MNIINQYQVLKYKSTFISKYTIQEVQKFPFIRQCIFFFFLDSKQYKKKIILFYIVISLFITGIFFLKKHQRSTQSIIKFTILNNKVFIFLYQFVHYYLPHLGLQEHFIKRIYLRNIKNQKKIYIRFTYFSFPIFLELDALLSDFLGLFEIVNSFKFQLDFNIIYLNYKLNLSEFLFRFFRVPCRVYAGLVK